MHMYMYNVYTKPQCTLSCTMYMYMYIHVHVQCIYMYMYNVDRTLLQTQKYE